MANGTWVNGSPPCVGFAPDCGGLNARHSPAMGRVRFVAGFLLCCWVWLFVGIRGEALVERDSESFSRYLIQACRRLVIGTDGKRN
jgi:hypothetical protein